MVLPSVHHSLRERPEPGSQPLGGLAGPRTWPLLGSSHGANGPGLSLCSHPEQEAANTPKKQPTKSPPHPTLLKKKIKKNKNGHQHLPGEEKSKWRCQALAVQEQGVSTPGPDTAALDEASSKKQQQTQPQPLCNG